MIPLYFLVGMGYLAAFGAPLFAGPPPAATGTAILDERLTKEVNENGFPSLSVGIVKGNRTVYLKSFGWADLEKKRAATPETMYRIGSITKVFTTTLLVMLRDEGQLRLDDPITLYLPQGITLPTTPESAPAITLRHLATHTSGFPRLPINLKPVEGDPYAGYSVALLYEGITKTPLAHPVESRISYSNLGMGLLGHLLELASGQNYESLLFSRIFKPLKMTSTTTSPEGPNFAQGYLGSNPPRAARAWDLGAIGPAGVLASNVPDMLRFLGLQLRAGEAGVTPVRGSTLAELHRPQRVFDGWNRGIGLGWLIEATDDYGDIVSHNGSIDGFRSFTAFSVEAGLAVVVLCNGNKPVDPVGRWLIRQGIDLFGENTLSPVQEDARIMAKRLSAFFVAEPGDKTADLFGPDFLKHIPLVQIKLLLANQYQQLGACHGIKTIKTAKTPQLPHCIEVVFTFEKGTSTCFLQVDRATPPKINYLKLQFR